MHYDVDEELDKVMSNESIYAYVIESLNKSYTAILLPFQLHMSTAASKSLSVSLGGNLMVIFIKLSSVLSGYESDTLHIGETPFS